MITRELEVGDVLYDPHQRNSWCIEKIDNGYVYWRNCQTDITGRAAILTLSEKMYLDVYDSSL